MFIEQCTGEAAKKVIAKCHIDIVTGNINSYAQILNGPQQLEKIRTFNELAATISVLKQEKEKLNEEQGVRRKREEQEKAARKAEREREAREKANELAPLCKAHVDQGLAHVLTLKVTERRDILRYHFRLASADIDGVSKAIYKLTLGETAIVLHRLMSPPVPLPALPQLPETQLNEA